MKYEEPLDDEQRAAVEATERAIAVLAGPGSGKTRVLSYRARHLLMRDKNSNCLLLTFTNKAASEMKSRAIAAAPVTSKRIRAGTFHNFGLSVLRFHGTHVGINLDFDVLDEDEQEAMAAQVANTAGYANLTKEWSSQRLRLQLPTAEVAKFGSAFESSKRKADVVDFDDLIVYALRLFREKPDIAKAYAANYQHILIDEFQDTNAAQFAVVRALAEHASPNSTISVFADDDQAIFGFAGAEAQNINRFCEELQAKIYPLTTNYRCAREIVAIANRLIKANRARGRHMKSNKAGGEVVARAFENQEHEARVVCDEIAKSIVGGTDPQRISILVRSGTRAEAIKAALVEHQIPYSNWLAGGYNAYETRLVRICLAAVRPVLTGRMCRKLCELLCIDEIPAGATTKTQDFLSSLESSSAVKHLQMIRKLAEANAKVSEIVKEICQCIEGIAPETVGLDTLVTEVAAFEALDPQYSLDHFLADLALGGKAGAPTESGGVKLATIHRTKGLQWPIVYLIGLEQGSLPNYYASQTDEGMREERRLCFVGVCRAEDKLNITRIKTYKGHTKLRSPFIDEMGVKEA